MIIVDSGNIMEGSIVQISNHYNVSTRFDDDIIAKRFWYAF